jgi:hypothetical protein
MNKKGFWKVLMVSLVMASAIGLMASGAKAQNIPTQELLQNEDGVQVNAGTILLDNFQYWNSPRDMGWTPVEPPYPIWGVGMGLGTMETVVDFQEGSRVLDVIAPPSVFLPMGTDQFMPYTATKMATYRDPANTVWQGIPGGFSDMSFKVRAPLTIEQFETFSMIVRVRTMSAATLGTAIPPQPNGTAAGSAAQPNGSDNSGTVDINPTNPTLPDGPLNDNRVDVPLGKGAAGSQVGCNGGACTAVGPFGIVDIVFVPREIPIGCLPSSSDSAARIVSVTPSQGSFVTSSPEGNVYNTNGQQSGQAAKITVALGREFQDGSWHFVSEDLQRIVNVASSAADNVFEVVSVTVRGNQYRLDDVIFTRPAASIANNDAPYLFHIGPVYGQLFNVNQGRYVFASDNGAPGTPGSLFFMKMAPARAVNATASSDAAPVFPYIEDTLSANTPGHGESGFNPANATFILGPVTQTSPGFYQPNLAAADGDMPAGLLGAAQSLLFQWNIGDALGSVSPTIATPVPLPAAVADISVNYMRQLPYQIPIFGQPKTLWPTNTAQTDSTWSLANHPETNSMYVLACAMVKAGFTRWPNMQLLRAAQGQVLEDMIVTCRVTDGLSTDEETFPISIVNYPVTNLPPIIDQLEDQFFQVGQAGVYQITATDPDAAASVFPNAGVQDQASLTFRATLNGIPSYQYGPWMNQIINPTTGTVNFTPQFEGSLTCTVTVSDPRGAQAVGHFNIFCVNSGTWLNHPPAVLKIIESPQIVRAGNLFTISDLRIADPDGQQLYYSCNIGAVGRNGVYTFQSEFPGEYLVQITAYDILGGAVTQQFVLDALPWWSY